MSDAITLLSRAEYLESIAVAYLAAPDDSDEERLLSEALHAAGERYGIDTDALVERLCDEAGSVYIEGEDRFGDALPADGAA